MTVPALPSPRTLPITSGPAMKALQALKDQRAWAFVLNLLADPELSQTQAAKDAGYALKAARSRATLLMKRDDVQAALVEGRQKLAERFEIDLDSVQQEMAAIGKSNIDQIFDFERLAVAGLRRDIPRKARKAIKSMKVRTSWKVTAPEGTTTGKAPRFTRPEDIVGYFEKRDGEGDDEDRLEIIEVEQEVEVTLWDKPKGLDLLARSQGYLSAAGGEAPAGGIGGIQVNVFTGAVPHVGADGEVRSGATIAEAIDAKEARTQVGGVGVAVRIIGPTTD